MLLLESGDELEFCRPETEPAVGETAFEAAAVPPVAGIAIKVPGATPN